MFLHGYIVVPLVAERFRLLDVHPEVILRRLLIKVRLIAGEKERTGDRV